ncbi:Kinase-like protein [Coniochaeta hoffmannii]|uniref:EKC/KEOPS complex subunit BUD32 n=1 Tax=Coniochaeta hoffmannii TaxID=91930 RepID=A0AA38RYW8_9PEZI|nr:Kinase-like protein [Coniochaeta hoffmannii]
MAETTPLSMDATTVDEFISDVPDVYGFPPIPYDVEDLERYRPGGLHPIIVGDTLGEGEQYEVVHKLGHGGFATVWLCWDHFTETWKAVKVVAASASDQKCSELSILKHFGDVSDEELAAHHICLPRTNFFVEGPNGRHLCIVMPVFGESLHRAWRDYANWPDFLRSACRQMTEAMGLMHGRGVCHGDFRPNNILFKVGNGFDKLDYDDIMSMARETGHIPVPPIPCTGEENSPHLPAFVYPSCGICPRLEFRTAEITITDFGEAYHVSEPKLQTGIPMCYSAPEAELGSGNDKGFATDIWALGATICEVRQGSLPFDEGSMIEWAQSLEDLLGPLPEPYRSVWVERGIKPSRNARPASEIPPTEPVSMTPKMLVSLRNERLEDEGYASRLEAVVRNKNGFLRQLQAGEVLRPNEKDDGDGWKRIEHQTPPEEADQLVDLLVKIFKYDPAERLSAAEVLAHPWLQVENASSVPDKDYIVFASHEKDEEFYHQDTEQEDETLEADVQLEVEETAMTEQVTVEQEVAEDVVEEIPLTPETLRTDDREPAPARQDGLLAWFAWVLRALIPRLYDGPMLFWGSLYP